jgi:hypothetical protein
MAVFIFGLSVAAGVVLAGLAIEGAGGCDCLRPCCWWRP